VLWWPADARPRLGLDVDIVGQDAEGDAWSGHLDSIAPGDFKANNPCLSGGAFLPPGKTVRKGAVTLISNLDRLASPRRAGDSRSRPKPRSGGAERASLDGLAAVRPARAQAVIVQFAFGENRGI